VQWLAAGTIAEIARLAGGRRAGDLEQTWSHIEKHLNACRQLRQTDKSAINHPVRSAIVTAKPAHPWHRCSTS